ncbi:MAG: glycosyltransferase family 4 protein, partial [Vallitaleaceae bacterium]|nr:glycosyltransferase family 4 protein [Vallitaleaceae bacterium]
MRVLYISTVFPRPERSATIYTDLAQELVLRGHKITVVAAENGSDFKKTALLPERNMEVLRVRTGRLYDVGFLHKGISVITLKYFLILAMQKYLRSCEFDFVLFETPPIHMVDGVAWAMKKYKCPSYLMLKDIFPQNAIDLGIIKKSSPLHWYFRRKEKSLYQLASRIGCMSEANKNYILHHNKEINPSKVEVFPNTKKLTVPAVNAEDADMRQKYNIPRERIICVYGGNMGKPQGLEFLQEILISNQHNEKA